MFPPTAAMLGSGLAACRAGCVATLGGTGCSERRVTPPMWLASCRSCRSRGGATGSGEGDGGCMGLPINVPCVKRPFEWEIHGSADLTTFGCVLRVTCCHGVRFSCYLCQKHGTTHVCNLEVSTSHTV